MKRLYQATEQAPRSKNRSGSSGATSLNPQWVPTSRTLERLGKELGKAPLEVLEVYLPVLRRLAIEREFMYRNWDVAFSNCVRQDWGWVRTEP